MPPEAASAPVSTHRTPGAALAASVWMPAIRACACGETPGSDVHDGAIYRAPIWAVFPFCISSPATGVARGALEAYVERMSERTSVFGNEKIAEMRSIHLHLAEAAALIDAAESLYKRSIRETIDKITHGIPFDMPHRVRSRRDQGYSIAMATRAVEHLFKSMGGKGLYESNPVQRAYRDLHAVAGQIANNWDLTAAMFGQVTLGGPPTDPFSDRLLHASTPEPQSGPHRPLPASLASPPVAAYRIMWPGRLPQRAIGGQRGVHSRSGPQGCRAALRGDEPAR